SLPNTNVQGSLRPMVFNLSHVNARTFDKKVVRAMGFKSTSSVGPISIGLALSRQPASYPVNVPSAAIEGSGLLGLGACGRSAPASQASSARCGTAQRRDASFVAVPPSAATMIHKV